MSLVINNNIPSLNAQGNITKTNVDNSKALERLSSGLRINRAGDDAAGLAISEKLRSQVRGLNQAVRNANDGISLVQTAEGGFNTITNIVQRLRELSVQSASDTYTSADRATLKTEADQLIAEINRIGNTTEFNTKTLLNGTFSSGKLHIGANFSQSITFTIGDIRAAALGTRASVTGTLTDGALNGINANVASGEVSVNGYQLLTTSSDDQVSVLEIQGGTISTNAKLSAGHLKINGTNISFASGGTASAHAQNIVNAINNAGITNVTARIGFGGTNVTLVVKKGTELVLHGSGKVAASLASILGIAASFIGSRTDVTTYNGQSSAIAKAAAVNKVKSDSTVGGTAKATVATGTAAITATTISAGQFFVNGVDIGAVTVLAGDGSGALVTAINAQTANTGVTASVNSSSQLVLTAGDGRNISVAATAAVNTALSIGGTTNSNNVYRSDVQLDSANAITVAGTKVTEIGSNVAATTYQTNLNNAVSSIDLSTQAGANSAILTLDAALSQLNSQRAQLGGLQNRLESTVDNLSTTSENLSASDSRIRDADFAAETAKFTRSQILLQAGTAILAQANTLPQLALQLLRG
jgi:flagellin